LVGGEKTFAFVVLGEMQSVEELSDLIGVGVEGQVQSIVNSNEKENSSGTVTANFGKDLFTLQMSLIRNSSSIYSQVVSRPYLQIFSNS